MSNSSSEAVGGRWWRARKLGSHDFTTRERPIDRDASFEVNGETPVVYRTYKRRWFGLLQLTLMNIVVSWCWLTYAPVATDAAEYYSVSKSAINWISTAFMLSFVAVFPVAIAVLHRGPKLSMMIASVLLLVGSWVRYGGSSSRSGGSFACAMVGEILVGFSQPFLLAAPTRYSDLWFTNRGRVAATALASLANPFGGALGQLIIPFWVGEPGDISNAVLYVAIIGTVASVPAFFLPSEPPSPVGPASETPKLRLGKSLPVLAKSLEAWLVMIPFSIYVGFFNSYTTLINQMMTPYGFSDDDAGIVGAILIVVGLVTAAIVSPIVDKNKRYLLVIKILVPIIATCYLIFIWMPETRNLAGPSVVLAVLGAASFALLPVALEYLIEISHPLSPEVTSTTAWAGGQFFGAIFIIISNALVADDDANPPNNMKNALIFGAVVAWVFVPMPLCIGYFGRTEQASLRRLHSDQDGLRRGDVTEL